MSKRKFDQLVFTEKYRETAETLKPKDDDKMRDIVLQELMENMFIDSNETWQEPKDKQFFGKNIVYLLREMEPLPNSGFDFHPTDYKSFTPLFLTLIEQSKDYFNDDADLFEHPTSDDEDSDDDGELEDSEDEDEAKTKEARKLIKDNQIEIYNLSSFLYKVQKFTEKYYPTDTFIAKIDYAARTLSRLLPENLIPNFAPLISEVVKFIYIFKGFRKNVVETPESEAHTKMVRQYIDGRVHNTGISTGYESDFKNQIGLQLTTCRLLEIEKHIVTNIKKSDEDDPDMQLTTLDRLSNVESGAVSRSDIHDYMAAASTTDLGYKICFYYLIDLRMKGLYEIEWFKRFVRIGFKAIYQYPPHEYRRLLSKYEEEEKIDREMGVPFFADEEPTEEEFPIIIDQTRQPWVLYKKKVYPTSGCEEAAGLWFKILETDFDNNLSKDKKFEGLVPK
jgi:hypothetical protein